MARKKKIPEPSAAPASTSPEGYTVLARRYRPQQFTEIVGQESVSRALENALKSNRVAHAYLFTGARGVGKTSTARILAKALNCEKGPTTDPCGVCEICQSIATGEDVDVLEIDGASNNGVEKVREIRSNVQYRPSRSRYKIYIIDEVHMLSTAAFNALLKTLEEPPPHVKFFFATTEAQKIPVTILSRCQRFDFSGISLAKIQERLKEILKQENMEAEEGAIEMVARRAGGSMRDAQSLLDQLLAFGSEKLTADQVHALLGTAGDDSIVEMATAVLSHNPASALEALGRLADQGVQFGELVDQLLHYWRDLMVSSCAGDQAQDLSVPPRHRETLKQQAQSTGLDTILAGMDILTTTRSRLKYSNHGRLLVEMALARLSRLENLVSLSQLADWIAQGGSPSSTPTPAGKVTAPPEVKKKLVPVEGPPPSKPIPLTQETLPRIWGILLGQIGQFYGNQLEKSGLPAISGPNTLVLSFPSDYNHEYSYCAEPDRTKQVEQALSRLTGESWQIRMEQSHQASSNGHAQRSSASSEVRESPLAKARRLKEQVENIPLVQRAMDVLGAEIKRVEEGFSIEAEESPPSEEAPKEET